MYFTISVSIHLSERSKCEAPVHVSARKCHIAIFGTQTEVGIRIYAAVSLSIRYEPYSAMTSIPNECIHFLNGVFDLVERIRGFDSQF
jgi:hypothetical protein